MRLEGRVALIKGPASALNGEPMGFGGAPALAAEALDEDVGFRNRPVHYLKAIR